MLTATPLVQGPVSATVYTCTATADARPYAEQHESWSLAYVMVGGFGCSCRGRRFELVPGAVMLGRPGDEYTCTHDHHGGGDQCLAFHFDDALADELGHRRGTWTSGALPPVAGLVTWGELARRAAQQAVGHGVDEIGMAMAADVADLIARHSRAPARPRSLDRARALESARWIEAHVAQDLDLQQMAQRCGLSVFHHLRVFAAVLGVTPHQYLLRCRLRRAAQLLADEDRSVTDIALDVGFADLSNFVRSFRRAAGVSPRAYRQAARGDRKIFQDRIALAA